MPSFNEFATTEDIVHAHAHGEIDPTLPLEFETGRPAYLHGILFSTGKCRMVRTQTSNHAELWAELYEAGARFLVHAEPDGGQAYLYNQFGNPMEIYDGDRQWPKGKYRLRNIDVAIKVTEELEAIDGWGSWS